MKLVPVNNSFMALIQDYSNETGVPIDHCISYALFEWLANVGAVTLENRGWHRSSRPPYMAGAPTWQTPTAFNPLDKRS
jgi:hypothetical protein